jgi:tetratricopeptide (TPR) repeat protein
MKITLLRVVLIVLATLCAQPAQAADYPAREPAGFSWEVPVEPNTAQARAELEKLIRELRSLSVSSAAPSAKTGKPSDPNAVAGSNKAAAERPSDANSPQKSSAPAGSQAGAGQKKQQVIAELDPNSAPDPFGLAETLYRLGRYAEAAACYKVAAARPASADKRQSEADRAWVLFQTGNCYAKFDPAEAIKAYRQLITDYPTSEWVPVAICREQLMQWYIQSGVAQTSEKMQFEKQQ